MGELVNFGARIAFYGCLAPRPRFEAPAGIARPFDAQPGGPEGWASTERIAPPPEGGTLRQTSDGSQGSSTWASRGCRPIPQSHCRSVWRPRCRILRAAFSSLSSTSPHTGQVWIRSLNFLGTISLQDEHILVVLRGFTRITRRPASAAPHTPACVQQVSRCRPSATPQAVAQAYAADREKGRSVI